MELFKCHKRDGSFHLLLKRVTLNLTNSFFHSSLLAKSEKEEGIPKSLSKPFPEIRAIVVFRKFQSAIPLQMTNNNDTTYFYSPY